MAYLEHEKVEYPAFTLTTAKQICTNYYQYY